jgi:hypothetical protein
MVLVGNQPLAYFGGLAGHESKGDVLFNKTAATLPPLPGTAMIYNETLLFFPPVRRKGAAAV